MLAWTQKQQALKAKREMQISVDGRKVRFNYKHKNYVSQNWNPQFRVYWNLHLNRWCAVNTVMELG